MKISIEIGNGVLLYRSSSVKCSHVIEKTEDRYISSLLFFPSSHLPLILQGKSSIMVHDNQHRLLFNEHSEKRDLGMLPPSPVTSCGVPIPTPHFHPKYATPDNTIAERPVRNVPLPAAHATNQECRLTRACRPPSAFSLIAVTIPKSASSSP